jgi:hypothetical protein
MKLIPNYEPPDRGWSVSLGRFRPKPEPKPEADERDEQQPASTSPDEAA